MTGKNFAFNQCHNKELCVFSRKSHFIKAIENFFPVFASSDINTQTKKGTRIKRAKNNKKMFNKTNRRKVQTRLTPKKEKSSTEMVIR